MKTIISQKNIIFLTFMLLVLLLTGCANNEAVKQCLTGHTYGFLGGLWHGFIAPFDFIGMLFNDKITMYAQNNNGGLYALGFLLAVADGVSLEAREQTKLGQAGYTFRIRNSIMPR